MLFCANCFKCVPKEMYEWMNIKCYVEYDYTVQYIMITNKHAMKIFNRKLVVGIVIVLS